MKLNKKLSTSQFFLSQFLLLVVGLILLGGLYYIVNVQYQPSLNPFAQGPLTMPPKTLRLDLDSPSDESIVFESSIIVSGKTSAVKDVLIFTDTQDLIITSKKDGSFSARLNLTEGINRIVATVFDNDGEQRTQERIIYYSKEKI